MIKNLKTYFFEAYFNSFIRLIFFISLITSCFYSGSVRGDDSYVNRVLKEHNLVRSFINGGLVSDQPVAEPELTPVQHHDSLSDGAQSWSDQCLWQHSSAYGGYAENMFATGYQLDKEEAITEAVQNWFNEHKSFDYWTGQCSGVCGHYTTLVQAPATSVMYVGCGVTNCTSGIKSPDGSILFPGTLVVCRYSVGSYNLIPYTTSEDSRSISSRVPTACYDIDTNYLYIPYMETMGNGTYNFLGSVYQNPVQLVLDSIESVNPVDTADRKPTFDINTLVLDIPNLRLMEKGVLLPDVHSLQLTFDPYTQTFRP